MLSQDEEGLLSIGITEPVDVGSLGGLAAPTGGLTSPWSTHLGVSADAFPHRRSLRQYESCGGVLG
jgi:hypothetical protein